MFDRFIASHICLHCLNALTKKIKVMMPWIPLAISVAKPKNIVVFAFTYVLESFALFYGDFCMGLYSVASEEAMKRWSEAMKR